MKLYKCKLVILTLLLCNILANGKSEMKYLSDEKSLTLNSQRVPRTDDDIVDPVLVYSIQLISSSKAEASCPYPLVQAESNCPEGCDLNRGAGGRYVYLCIGKKKLSEFGDDEKLINSLKVNFNNKDCGNLNTIETKLKNSWMFSDELYLCYGHLESKKPLKDITVLSKSDKNSLPAHCTLEITPKNFLCLEYEDKGPKKIEYGELSMATLDQNFKSLGQPEIIAEIENDNGSGKSESTLKRSITSSSVKSSAWNIEHKFGTKVDVKFTVKTGILIGGAASIGSTFDLNYSKNRGEVVTQTEVNQVDFNCMAPAGKFYKCRAYFTKYEANIPYAIKRTVTYFDGSVETKLVHSNFYGVMSSSIRFDRCCYMNCEEGKDHLCDDAEKTPSRTNGCPSVDKNVVVDDPELEEIKLDPELDLPLVEDIKVYEGAATDCPNGYEKMKEYTSQKVIGFGDKYFICFKTLPLSKVDSPAVNVIKIIKNSQDCGTLILAKTMIYSKSNVVNSDQFYLCFGYDPLLQLPPISDLKMVKEEDLRTITDFAYACKIKVSDDKYLCYLRHFNAPKRVELKEFNYNTEAMKKQQLGMPRKIQEIIVSSSSLTVTVKAAKVTDTSIRKALDFGATVTIGLAGNFAIVEASASASGSYRKSRTQELKEGSESTETMVIECLAPENKKFKCFSSMIDYKLTMPYTAKLVSYDYAGREMIDLERQITGTLVSMNSGNVNVRSCCLEGCCTNQPGEEKAKPWCAGAPKDNLCEDVDKCFFHASPLLESI